MLACVCVCTFTGYAWTANMINQWEGENNIVFVGGETVLQYYSMSGTKWGNVG